MGMDRKQSKGEGRREATLPTTVTLYRCQPTLSLDCCRTLSPQRCEQKDCFPFPLGVSTDAKQGRKGKDRKATHHWAANYL